MINQNDLFYSIIVTIGILFVVVFYLMYQINILQYKLLNVENFDTITDIKTAINAQYTADVEAIRNLSSIATQLTTSGLTVPGGLKINNGTKTNTYMNTDGSASFANDQVKIKNDGSVSFANDKCKIDSDGSVSFADGKCKINSDGSVSFANGNVTIDANGQIITKSNLVAINLTVSNDVNVNGGWVRVSGNNGIYWQSWGGGWHMVDNTWIRTYGSKRMYSDTGIRTDGPVEPQDLNFIRTNSTIFWPGGPSNRHYRIYGSENGGCHKLMFCEHDRCAAMDDGNWNGRQGAC
jgi:hypothetical protein